MKNFLLAKTLLLAGLMTVTTSSLVLAQTNPLENACDRGSGASNSSVCTEAEASTGGTNPITGDGGIANTIARLLSFIVAVASVIMLILGGLAFVTAGGNPEQESRARKRVIYGVVGLAVAVLSWTIITFVLERLLE